MSDQIASLFAAIGANTSTLDQALGDSAASLADFQGDIEGATEAVEEFESAADDAGEATDEISGGSDTFKMQMRGLKDTLEPLNMAIGLYSAGLDMATAAAERLGRNELPEALDRAAAAGQRAADSLFEVEFSMFGLQKRDAITWLTDAADGFTNLTNAVGNADIFMTAFTGTELTQEQQNRVLALTYQDVTLSVDQLAQAEIDMADPMDESNRLMREQASAAEGAQAMADIAAQKMLVYQDAVTTTTGPVSDLTFAMGELTSATLFNQAAQNLDSEAALQLAVSMGRVDEKTLAVKEKLDDARIAFDSNKDGMIDATEAANGYNAAVNRINDSLYYAERQAAATAAAFANAVANGAGVNAGGGVVAGGSGGFAEGGISSGPSSGYMQLLHGTEAVIPLKNGSVPVEVSGGSGGGPWVYELIALIRGLPEAIKRAVRDGLLTSGLAR